VPLCPATSHAPALMTGSLPQRGLVRTTLYVLLFLVLACTGDLLHASERSHGSHGRSAAAESDVPLSAASFEEDILDILDGTEFPHHCHESGSGPATATPSAARILPLALTTGSAADTTGNLASAPSKASQPPPSGGRPALIAICRWRI
jgi:hypothetical protein